MTLQHTLITTFNRPTKGLQTDQTDLVGDKSAEPSSGDFGSDSARPDCSNRGRRLVYNGEPAGPGEIRSTVALLDKSTKQQFCGGGLSKSVEFPKPFVTTAAHCLEGKEARDILVVAGEENYEDPCAEEITVESIRMHPGYTPYPISNDIAVLFLTKTPHTPATEIGNIEYGKPTNFAGWGLNQHGEYPKHALTVNQTAISSEECANLMPYPYLAPDESFFCATVGQTSLGDAGQLWADSGTFLYQRNSDGSFRAVGVVSWGFPTYPNPPLHPTAFSKIQVNQLMPLFTPLPPPLPPYSPNSLLCDDSCPIWTKDGYCDDGGEGSVTAWCDIGTDCLDCGPRFIRLSPNFPPGSPSPLYPPFPSSPRPLPPSSPPPASPGGLVDDASGDAASGDAASGPAFGLGETSPSPHPPSAPYSRSPYSSEPTFSPLPPPSSPYLNLTNNLIDLDQINLLPSTSSNLGKQIAIASGVLGVLLCTVTAGYYLRRKTRMVRIHSGSTRPVDRDRQSNLGKLCKTLQIYSADARSIVTQNPLKTLWKSCCFRNTAQVYAQPVNTVGHHDRTSVDDSQIPSTELTTPESNTWRAPSSPRETAPHTSTSTNSQHQSEQSLVVIDASLMPPVTYRPAPVLTSATR